MKIFRIAFLAFICLLSIANSIAQNASRIAIIPRPSSVIDREGVFNITPNTKIYSDPAFLKVASLLAEQTTVSAMTFVKQKSAAQIRFLVVDNKLMPDSVGYRLQITPHQITISARSVAGAIYGMQSLLQLILLQPKQSIIPCAEIVDHPRFDYRGVHLDVSRHFFPVSYIKRFLDIMGLYKMNNFHWHLTDGPGWRIEIKKYPELTSRAAWRTHNNWKDWWETPRKYSQEGSPNAYGGYYTQEQAREVVAYAAKRGIRVIPEIEMPGHSDEVLDVYPQLSCTGKPYKCGEMCLGNEETYVFLENVITEIMAIFPSEYIHIGGDEANKEPWKKCVKCQQRMKDNQLKDELELQSYCIRRMEKFINAHGRKLLGWDEILEGGLAPEATVMSWRGEQGGITAAEMGHKVIMTPGGYCYFDSYQADPLTQPLAIGGFLLLEKVYSYDPVPAELNPSKANRILGAQACIWTEYIPTTEHLEYMVFPRLLALSEVCWTSKNNKNWDNFKTRLQSHYRLMQGLNINYCRPSYQLAINTTFDYTGKKVNVKFKSDQYYPVIYYSLDGTQPTVNATLYKGSFDVLGATTISAAIFENGEIKSAVTKSDVDFHRAIGKLVTYNSPFCLRYGAQKEATLVNGTRGSFTYGDGQWQGFETKDMDVTIDLEASTLLKSLSVGFMQQTGPGVFIPDSVILSVSDNDKDFRRLEVLKSDIPATQSELTFKDFKFNLIGQKARFVRLVAVNGHRGFLFADEVVIY